MFGLQSFSCVLLTDAYRIDMVWNAYRIDMVWNAYRIDMVWNEREWIDYHKRL